MALGKFPRKVSKLFCYGVVGLQSDRMLANIQYIFLKSFYTDSLKLIMKGIHQLYDYRTV